MYQQAELRAALAHHAAVTSVMHALWRPVLAQAVVLGFSTKRLRACLLAWQQQARVLSGAAHLLRRLLAVTVRGAFHEWRTVAQERAHWHRVSRSLCWGML